MKRLYSYLILFFTINLANAQIQLSNFAEVSILTIGPGTSLNDAFGHSAIRIKDPMYRLDAVFDYGRYDFEAEGFYLNFAKGKLTYEIGWADYSVFINHYKNVEREVKAQTLNLNSSEKQALFQWLQKNIQPQNKSYSYDFFYNNCATKIKDTVESICEDAIVYSEPTGFKPQTFRTLIRSKVARNSWGGFGIDLALGSVIDQIVSTEDHMFLPINIHAFFETARFQKSNEPLIKKQEIISATQKTVPSFFWTSPIFIFGLLSLLLIFQSYRDFKTNSRAKWLDVSIFTITGCVGVIVLLLWFATDHTATAYNYNFLWAFAFNLLLIPTALKERVKKRFVGYLKFLLLLLLLMLLHWCTGVQSFNIALIPIWIGLMVRYIYLCQWSNQHLIQEHTP